MAVPALRLSPHLGVVRYNFLRAPPALRGSGAAVHGGLRLTLATRDRRRDRLDACVVAYLVVSIPLGGIQALGAVSWRERDFGGMPGEVLVVATQVLTVAPAIAYFAALLPTSHTFGMRARDIRIISLRTGRAPSYVVAAVRAVLTVAVAASVYVMFGRWTSMQGHGDLDRSSRIALHFAYVLAGGAGLSALLTTFTPSHRNLFDRIFGTAVVDELEAVAPVMGPWGPLNSFDLSYERLASDGQ